MKRRKTLQERIVDADTAASRFLANANELSEAGRVKAAEREMEKAQRALDRLNVLLGQGS